jgi:hypothetical protein
MTNCDLMHTQIHADNGKYGFFLKLLTVALAFNFRKVRIQ